MTLSQDEQGTAARAEPVELGEEKMVSSTDELANASPPEAIEESFDLDDFDDDFDDDFEAEIEGEYEMENDIYAEQLAEIIDLDGEEFDNEFGKEDESDEKETSEDDSK